MNKNCGTVGIHESEQIRKAAEEELEQERTRERIDQEKDRIRRRRSCPWWQKLFPYTVSINRRDES